MMHFRSGDTIIEVIMAVTVFSMIAVGTITIMNSGISTTQRSLEITLARQEVDAQAEMLRYVHDHAIEGHTDYVALWNSVKANTNADVVTNISSLLGTEACPASISNSIVFIPPDAPPNKITLSSNYSNEPVTYAKIDPALPGRAYGISVQITKVDGDRAYDAYIQSCWQAPGSDMPATIGTIVRLYDANA